ncbi:MAG: alpha/beta fold hydrolase [Clostridia bacterium]|nr:alpha/beta fold hydrolase [Clostridia bacterium]
MNTKYPIILVHGLFVKDVMFLKSFGKIDKKLEEKGFFIYKSKIGGMQKIEDNALILKKEILEILKTKGTDKVNIIAHSQGGLVAKYVITEMGMEDSVASLTTLCTPHRGTPFASGLVKLPRFQRKVVELFLNLNFKILGDKKPDSLSVGKELSDNRLMEDNFPFDKIYAQSYSVKMEKSSDDRMLAIPFNYILKQTNGADNDGLVPCESAKFGEYKGLAFDEPFSHSQIIDNCAKRKQKKKLYGFYEKVCNELAEMGF